MLLNEAETRINGAVDSGSFVCYSCHFSISAKLAVKATCGINVLSSLFDYICHKLRITALDISILDNIDEGLVHICLEIFNLIVSIYIGACTLHNNTYRINAVGVRKMIGGDPIAGTCHNVEFFNPNRGPFKARFGQFGNCGIR